MIYLLLLFSDIIWGLNIVITKLNYSSFHPIFLVFLKLFFSFFAMCFILYLKHGQIVRLEIKDIIINANLINVFNFLLTYFALTTIKGVISATINCLAPLMMALISFLYNKTIDHKVLYFLIFIIFGFLCTIHFEITSLSMGHFFSICALFSYNLGNYRLKDIKSSHLLFYNTIMLLISFIEITIIALFFKDHLFTEINTFYLWLFVLTSGFGYALIQSVYFYSIIHLGPLKTSLFLGLSPLMTYFFSILILKETIDLYLIIGFAIVLSSSLFMMYNSKNDK